MHREMQNNSLASTGANDFNEETSQAHISSSINASNNSALANSSFKELRKHYSLKKKCFTKNIHNAIESAPEIHSGWLKARTTFKRWTKLWCQVKSGYLILYTSQEAQHRHRLGVIILSVCQVIIRPTKKDGFCFKLINPFDCSVWAKSSTRAIAFSHASLTLRASDSQVGKLWLDALKRSNLSSNLEGCQAIIDEVNDSTLQCNQSMMSDSDDGDCSTRNLDGLMLLNNNNNIINNNNISNTSSMTSIHEISLSSGADSRNHLKIENSAQLQQKKTFNSNQFKSSTQPTNSSQTNLSASKMVAKFSKYSWRELKLENVEYNSDELEELGNAGMQTEAVHESNKNFLWHIIKQLRPGMDLSKVTLPTFILEPRSFLEKLADYYYHCDILSDAVLMDDPLARMINVVKWYLSGFYKKPKGPKKPYNPILGERFRCFWEHPKTQSRTFFVAEQVSHHPPVSAFHVSNRKDGYTINCSLLSRSKYGGNSVSAILDGKAKLYLTKRNETYTITMPYANCRGILLGSLCMELGGRVEIECKETNCRCELDFKLAPVWANANSYNSLTGRILMYNKITHTLDGPWDKKITIVDKHTEEKKTLWEVTDVVRHSRLKRYTVALNDQDDRESVRLWMKVSEALKANNQDVATIEKTKLENMQRQEARDRQGTFTPEHFIRGSEINDWSYKWLDNRQWDERRDIMQFEDNFKIRTLVLTSSSGEDLNQIADMPLTRLDRVAEKLGLTEDPRQAARTDSKEGELVNDVYKTIESKMEAENILIKQAIEKVSERNRKLEEDLATLKRGKKIVALIVTAVIVAILSAYMKYCL